jgi:glucosamine--fructose-6-phosphate aminotransferase (isomerizing)
MGIAMCGVIGYVGRRAAKERLLQGLERLEYRGYDSAGICLLGCEGLESVKAVGKLERLKRKAGGVASRSTAGIGHTRWATHGRVTEENAHPLSAGEDRDVAIVLNGIIENHAEIRRALIADGERFCSETDAEVVAHLVKRGYAGDLVEAVRAASAQLRGHFAFIAVHREHPDLLVGTRHQCPLIAGLGDGENFLASSITAFATDTRRVKYLEDGDIVAATRDMVRVIGADGEPRERDVVVASWDEEIAEKGGYESFMLKEIHEQPRAVGETITRNLHGGALGLETLGGLELADVRRIVVVACGTAYHAGQVGRYLIEEWAGLPCDVEVASEWRYRRPLIEAGTLVVGISQSGETADTLAGLRLARQCGAPTLAITNSPGSQITREVDAVLYTHAGIEIGVAATKTFTSQIALLLLFALRLAELRGSLGDVERAALMGELRSLPQKLISTLERQSDIVDIAERHHDKPFFFYVGRHVGLPVCLEGALKLKEISYIPTEAYAAGEMKHGPIALLDDHTPVVCVATDSHVTDKLASNLQEIRARAAQVIAVATDGSEAILDVADDVVWVPRTSPLLQPVLAAIPLQLLAYQIARLRGLDVDQPRNLAKTVTVE